MTLPQFPLSVALELYRRGGYGAVTPRVLEWYLELAAYAKGQGSTRLHEAFLRASRWERHPEMKPLQNPVDLYVPGLGQAPFFERGELPFMRELERNHATIKAELIALRDNSRFTTYAGSLARNDWLSFHFFESGHRFARECALCPETARIIESIPGHDGGLVGFFAVTPGGKIDGHYGMHNAKARGSLGVMGCKGANIMVGDQVRQWEEGVCLALDDSYCHQVWHTGPDTRFVLLMDVWHPNLSPVEVEILDHYYTTSPIRAIWLLEIKREAPVDPSRWWKTAA
jgi:hypothetical protein